MEVKDTSLSEISGESGILCTVVALASAEFALIPVNSSPIQSIFCGFIKSRNVDIRSELSMAPSWNPGNVETRNILVGGVDRLHVHSHGSEGHIVERNIGRIWEYSAVVALASVEFSLILAGFFFAQPKKV
jgi:hypothetical protein